LRDVLGRSDTRFQWLARQVPVELGRQVQALDLPGIRVLPEAHRTYPQGRLASQILGFTNIDGTGLEGLESRWDDKLLGDAFRYSVERDGRRRPTNYDAVLSRRSTEGATLVLTLDQTVQHRAESALAAAIERHAAAGGWAVALDADTGAVLAMASNPGFDPTHWKGSDPKQWRNRAATDVYEPGSTMKALVFAEVLDRGLAKVDEQIYCERGNYRVGGRVVHDAHPHDWLSVADVLKVSSNIGTAKLADRIGPELLEASYREFGMGARTGIDLAGEEVGILRSHRTWGRIGFANHAFGQGMAVTGVQLAAAYCTLVNGGHRVHPHVVKELRGPDGAIVERWAAPERVQVISPETSQTMRELLGRVVEPGGTGPRAALAEYRVGGKTGTAQKVKGGVYAAGLYVSSFIGFAPVEDPRVVTLVVLDEPKMGHYGGTVAGPAFGEITLTAMRSLGVPPSPAPTPPPAPEGTPAVMPEEPGDVDPATLPAPSLLAEEGPAPLAPLWIADLADPSRSNAASKQGPPRTLLAVAGGWIVPDLSGLNVRDALAVLSGADVHLDVLGSGRVEQQAPVPGSRIQRGERLSLTLAPTPIPGSTPVPPR
jgi:cell division protein FtsI (penicillin-binding protein 3)